MDDYLHLTTVLKNETIVLDSDGWVLNKQGRLFIEYVDETKTSFYIYCTTKDPDRRYYMIAGSGLIAHAYLSVYEYTNVRAAHGTVFKSSLTVPSWDRVGRDCRANVASDSIAEFCVRNDRLYLIQRTFLSILSDVFTSYSCVGAQITASSVKLTYSGSANAELFAQVRVQ
jgi:hypothetical protein